MPYVSPTQQKGRNRFAGGFGAPKKPEDRPYSALFQPDSFRSGSFGVSKSTSATPVGPSTADIGRSFAQGIGKGYLATGQALSAPFFGATLAEMRSKPLVHDREDTFLGQLTRNLSGTDKPISLAQEDIDLLGEDYGKATGGNLAIAFGLTDLVGGSGVKGIVGLSKAMKAAKTAGEAAKSLRAAGFAADLVEGLAPRMAKLDDLAQIEKELLAAEKLQNTTKSTAYTPVAERNATTDPLIAEARKYGSAEEFVDSRPSLFHTTSRESAEAIESGGFKAAIGDRSSSAVVKGKGVFFYDDIAPTVEFGKNFTRVGKEPAVVEAKVLGKIFNSTDEYASINMLANDTKLINKLKDEGYVGIRGEEMGTPVTFVFDETAIKTKSQFTDIYNKAQVQEVPIATRQTIEETPVVEAIAPQRTLVQGPDGSTQRVLQAQAPKGLTRPTEQISSLPETLPQKSSVVKDGVGTTLTEETYLANREGFKKGAITKVKESFKKGFGSIGEGADVLLGTISTRLKNIDPSLKTAIRKYEFRLATSIQKDHKQVAGFLKGLKKSKIIAGDYADLDLALKNGDAAKTRQILKKYGLTEEFSKVQKALDGLYERAKAVGYDIGYRKDYFPRTIKDSSGLLEYLQKGDDWSIIDETIKAKEMELGRYLSVDEKANMVNSLVRGYGGKVTLSETGAMKARRIDVVDAELNQFYNDSIGSLINYIDNTNDAIEARKFFGKSGKGDEFGNIEDSIGKYILDLLVEGKIKPSQEKELSRILKARFNEIGTSGFIGQYKNLAYIDTMGSVTSAITQIGDLSFSLYKAGPIRTVTALGKAIAGKSEITRADIGIEKIAQEFNNSSKTAKEVSLVFKAIGLEKLDAIGKETLINASMSKLQSRAKKPNSEFYKKLEAVFGDDPDVLDMVTADLKTGRVTEDTKLLAFNELLDFQPVALSEMPEMYLKGGNGRIFYMLKTYTIKLFDVYRNEVFSQIKTNPVKGIRNLVALASSLIVMNATADEIKDLILNRETSLSDRVVDNVIRLAGFSKYTIYTAREEGVASALLKTILPPVKFFDSLSKDITRQNEVNELETIESIPIGGKLYYWWFGKGASKSEKKRESNMESEFGKSSSSGGSSGMPLPPSLSGSTSGTKMPLPPSLNR